MARRIVVLATLDTKADEAQYLARGIESRGHEPVLVDLSLGDGTSAAAPAITREEIARAAGTTVAALARYNGLADPNRLSIGQVLLIPTAS